MPSVKITFFEDGREQIFQNAIAYEDSELGYLLIYDIDTEEPTGRGKPRARVSSRVISQWGIIEDEKTTDEEERRPT